MVRLAGYLMAAAGWSDCSGAWKGNRCAEKRGSSDHVNGASKTDVMVSGTRSSKTCSSLVDKFFRG